MVEPEVAFMDLDGDMQLAEEFVAFIVGRVLETRREELAGPRARRDQARTRDRAVSAHHLRTRRSSCSGASGHPEAKVGDDFGGDEETVISSQFDRPVIVHRYPMTLKAFYFKRDAADDSLALNMDVLAPEGYGEIVGGGQREDDLAKLEAAHRRATSCRARRSSGTSTCAATARSRTPASASASSARWRGSAACRTCARRSRFPRMLNRLAP